MTRQKSGKADACRRRDPLAVIGRELAMLGMLVIGGGAMVLALLGSALLAPSDDFAPRF